MTKKNNKHIVDGRIDPITLQIIGGALHTIATEMSHVVEKMAYSSLIRESEDLGAGLYNKYGHTMAEGESTPMQLGSLPGYIKGFQSVLGEDHEYKEGDIIWNNDPYAGASHSPDISLSAPVLYEGELVGFASTTAHHLDIGGSVPGLIIDAPDVYAEGLVLNGIKYYDSGVRNETLAEVVRQNVRTPKEVLGDLEAQVAGCRLGVKRFIKLMDRYGKDTVLLASEELMNYSERMMRQQIAKVPDGVYEADSWLDDDGRNLGKRLYVHVQVTIKDDELEIDVSKSADQVSTAYNSAYSGALCVAVYSMLRAIFLDTAVHEENVPPNYGTFRPVTIIAREGSIFNPKKPAATFSRANQVNTVNDCILKALAPIIPEQTAAGGSANIQFASYSGLDEKDDYWIYIEVNEGSYGGRPGQDGMDAIDYVAWNTRNNPIEDLDMHMPIVCEKYELRDDTGGAGQFRGGLGIERWNRFTTGALMTMEGDKHSVRPWGFKGGLPGTPASLTKNPDKDAEELPSKLNGYQFDPGESVLIKVPSSGGHGDPLERPAEKVYEDVLDDFVSVETAYRDYGVVIENGNLNLETTAQRRKKKRETRGELQLYTE